MAKEGHGPAFAEEAMLYVGYTELREKRITGGHTIRRGEVMADIGLEKYPNPVFTSEDMQRITYAAKMEALRCLRKRIRAERMKHQRHVFVSPCDEQQAENSDKCARCDKPRGEGNHVGNKRRKP